MSSDDQDAEPIDELNVDTFEPGTTVSRMSDGTLRLRLALMPPSWATLPFDSFQDELESALGVAVTGLDKELFAVLAPRPDTVDRIFAFLAAVRARN